MRVGVRGYKNNGPGDRLGIARTYSLGSRILAREGKAVLTMFIVILPLTGQINPTEETPAVRQKSNRKSTTADITCSCSRPRLRLSDPKTHQFGVSTGMGI